MEAKRDEQHHAGLKVVDRRKFNADGSRREDAEEAESAEIPAPALVAAAPAPEAKPAETKPVEAAGEDEIAPEDGQAAERGTPLLSLMYSLATSAQMALGDIESPAAGGRYVNMEEAQGYVDILADIERKTEGRLTATESRFLRSALYELRLRFTARQQEFLTRRKP